MNLRYVQFLDALDFGDAVSNQVIRIHQMLLEKGERSQIFSLYADCRVDKYRYQFSEFKMDEETIIILHFAGKSEVANTVSNLRGYKIIIYHNITPPKFFEKGTAFYEFCKDGLEQFHQVVGKYNLLLGDSPFNCQEAKSLGATQTQELPIIVTDFSQDSVSQDLVKQLRADYHKVWLFVGRVAPNKRQDLLVDIFANYIKVHPQERHHLYLVGRYFHEDAFYTKVCSKINELELNQKVTLVGKVEDKDLPAYYKVADLFLCVSEHEGFCVPIVEAFNNKVPVIAFAGTAVADTMGGGPGALDSLDVESAINRIYAVFTDPSLKNELIRHGLNQANRFTPVAVRQRLYSIIDEITVRNKQKEPLRISIVICTCNRKDYLRRCLNYLKDQDYPHFEVIVVNGPSTDNTMDILSNRKDIKVVQNSLRNLSVSRNLGIQQAAGDIVAFIDDDALPYDNWLTELVKRYREVLKNVVGIGGRTFFTNEFRFQFEAGVIDSFGNHFEVTTNDIRITSPYFYRQLLGTNCSFIRDALIAINGFDEQYDYYLDESDLAVRLQKAGGVIVNANNAYVRHEFAKSHNRLGKYKFNWRVIAKNTVYFGMKNANQMTSVPKRILITFSNILRNRCLFFFNAWHHNDLGFLEAIYYSYCVVTGALRGYFDSCFPRRLGKNLTNINSHFLPYIKQSQNNTETMEKTSSEKQKLHILIISQEFPPNSYGGIGAYNQTLTRELIQMGHEVTVISRGSKDSTDVIGPLTHIQVASVEYSDCIPEYPILSKNLAWARKAAQIAQQVHRERPISVIESALWDVEGIGVLMLRPEFRVPLVVRLVTPLLVSIKMNGWQMTNDLKLCAEMEKELVCSADTVIAISNSIKDSVVSTYDVTPNDRWFVQPLGVQPWPTYTNVTNYGELPKDLKRGSIQILFVGRLESRKGIDIFLNALKLILPKNSKIFVWIAGADIEGWVEKANQILGRDVQTRVQFLGMVDEERRELLYANCDFLVFPSRYESFGLVPLEAMVHSKPVIGARAGAIPEVVVEGECGLLFEPDNHQDLAEKILTLVNDETLRCKLAKGAKERVEVLSSRNMAKASVEVYHSLVNSATQLKIVNNQIIEKFQDVVLLRERESQNVEDSVVTDIEVMKDHPSHQVTNLNVRSDWTVKFPTIKTWGLLNVVFNRFIVPKLVKFINSVLHESMHRQTSLNSLIIYNSKILQEELAEIKKSIADKNNSVDNELSTLKNSLESVKKNTSDIATFKESLEALKQDRTGKLARIEESIEAVKHNMTHELATVKESIEVMKQSATHELATVKESIEVMKQSVTHELATVKESIEVMKQSVTSELVILKESIADEKKSIADAFIEMKKLLFNLQNLTSVENEMSRSEFAYRLKSGEAQHQIIINPTKVNANLDDLRLNLGCGQVIMPDYINVDQRELPGIDVVSNVADLPFEKKTVSEIYSAHLIEHFTEYEVINHILPYWYELLKDGGKIVVICPDAKSMILDYANSNFSWESLRKVTYGAQDYAGNYHYNMFTPESLCQILSNCGFKDVNVMDTKRVNGLCYEMEIHAIK